MANNRARGFPECVAKAGTSRAGTERNESGKFMALPRKHLQTQHELKHHLFDLWYERSFDSRADYCSGRAYGCRTGSLSPTRKLRALRDLKSFTHIYIIYVTTRKSLAKLESGNAGDEDNDQRQGN